MTTVKKIISLMLCIVLIFSSVSVIAEANEVVKTGSIEQTISNDGLRDLVDILLRKLSANKSTVTGGILRLVFMAVKNGEEDINTSLASEIANTGKSFVDLTDDRAATVLLNWLQASVLPSLSEAINGLDNTIVGLIKTLTKVDLNNINTVDGLLSELYDAGNSTILHAFGDLKKLTSKSLKVEKGKNWIGVMQYRAIRRSDGDLKVVYALIDWIDEISPILEYFVHGGISSKELNLGSLENLLRNNSEAINQAFDDINKIINNLTTFIKAQIYTLIDSNADGGEIKENPAGDWGNSAYASYTADQLLAALVYNALNGKLSDETVYVVPVAECNAMLSQDVYTFFTNAVKSVYLGYGVEWLNGGLVSGIKDVISLYNEDIADLFNEGYLDGTDGFKEDSFNEVFSQSLSSGSFITDHINSLLMVFAKVMLKPGVIAEMGLEDGGNNLLNDNVAKCLRKIITYFGTDEFTELLGIDYSGITPESADELSAEDIITLIVKGFFKPLLNFTEEEISTYVEPCTNLEQLVCLILDRVFGLNVSEDIVSEANASAFLGDYANVSSRTETDSLAKIIENCAKVASLALASVDILDYTAPSGDYLTSVTDALVYLVRGIPAISTAWKLYEASSGTKDAWYKLDAIANNLISLNFITNSAGRDFDVDAENVIVKGVLGNILNVDLEGLCKLIERNNSSICTQSVTNCTINVIDKLINAIFVADTSVQYHADRSAYVIISTTATCTEGGTATYACPRCNGNTYQASIGSSGHTIKKVSARTSTCARTGNNSYFVCSECELAFKNADGTVSTTKAAETIEKINHSYTGKIKANEDGTHSVKCVNGCYLYGEPTKCTYETQPVTQATCTEGGLNSLTCTVCGYNIEEETEELGHSYEAVVTAPTCENGGYTTYTCTVCKDSYTADEKPATGHNYGAWTSNKNGTHSRVCLNDRSHKETVNCAFGEATCEESAKCSVCGYATGDPVGHDYNGVETKPDCTNGGYTTYTCTRCGDEYVADETSALGHDMVTDKAVAATCEETGLTEGSHCSRCDAMTVKQEVIPALGHKEVTDEAKDATCENTGLTAGSHCSVCNKVLVAQKEVAALGHTTVTVKGTPATCEEAGLTDGTYCSVCEKVLTEQKEISANGHTEVTDKGTPATCEEAGLTDGSHCSVCGKVLTVQETIPATGHTIVIAKAVDAKCEEDGLTEGSHCSACDMVLVEQEVIPATGHTEVADEAKDATCEDTGLTAGSHCSVCNKVLVAQKEVAALGHTTVTVKGTPATCEEAGLTDGTYCSVCEKVLTEQKEISANGHTEVTDKGTPETCEEAGLTDGSHCSVCGKVLTAQKEIPAPGHKVVTDAAVDAKCEETGLTEGSHCSVCGKVFAAQTTVEALGHTEVTDEAKEATCEDTGLTAGSHCSVCNKVLVAQKEVAALGHTETVIGEAVAPTCVYNGITAGVKCSVCGKVLEERTAIPAEGHTAQADETTAVEATCTSEGKMADTYCVVCGETLETGETIPMTKHTYGEWVYITYPTDEEKGVQERTCTVCGLVQSRTVSQSVPMDFEIVNIALDTADEMLAEGNISESKRIKTEARVHSLKVYLKALELFKIVELNDDCRITSTIITENAPLRYVLTARAHELITFCEKAGSNILDSLRLIMIELMEKVFKIAL